LPEVSFRRKEVKVAENFYNKVFCLEVWGDYACFTRPEMKVERVSYDVITPSAARGIFEAIFWKPAIRWRVKKVEILNPICWTSVRRNEVGCVMTERNDGFYIEEQRQQRAGVFLKDVRYRLHAELEFVPLSKRATSFWKTPNELVDPAESAEPGRDENPGKYNAMFERRAVKGQCFSQPYLGCREFSANFKLVQGSAEGTRAIDETRDLGFMLYDLDFSDPANPTPAFFRAKLENGVMAVPDWGSDEVRR
jgi:CRISPR-associated protein Cas5d